MGKYIKAKNLKRDADYLDNAKNFQLFIKDKSKPFAEGEGVVKFINDFVIKAHKKWKIKYTDLINWRLDDLFSSQSKGEKLKDKNWTDRSVLYYFKDKSSYDALMEKVKSVQDFPTSRKDKLKKHGEQWDKEKSKEIIKGSDLKKRQIYNSVSANQAAKVLYAILKNLNDKKIKGFPKGYANKIYLKYQPSK